ncbi:MAG TPA: diacylglycerol kinase family protein [Solirubrobacteraceae bacterium]|jgi:diacylglycerol kinase family enzyme|nr:diacylglycerol kinase family protein [Solirubrobacteraceae bacterium]
MVPTAQAAALERLADTSSLAQSVPARRMLVIVNPYATTMSVRLKQLVVYALQGRYDVEAIDTQRKGHATELCREAAVEGYDVVAAFGGDGTVNEVANGLVGSRTALVPLPGGATNVYCRMLGIPTDVVDATEHLLRLADAWAPKPVDLGRVNDRWFTFSAGAGLDASVVERVDRHPRLKAKLGPWYYAQAATAVFLEKYVVNAPKVVAELGGEERAGASVFVQNAQPYTYFRRRPITLSPGAALDSGDLSAVVLARANALDLPTIAYRLLAKRAQVGRHRQAHAFDGVGTLRVRSCDDRPVPVQVDGDYIGEHEEAVFSVRPGALRVLA